MNPTTQSEHIIARRSDFLGLTSAVRQKKNTEPQTRDRERARQRVDRLREQFWSLSADALKSELDVLNTKSFPELQPAVERMRLVSIYRPEFVRLLDDKHIDMELFNTFKDAVVLPGREAGPLKEQLLSRYMSATQLRKRKRMVKRIKKAYPHLYALETDWFQHIEKLKPIREQDYDQGSSLFASDGWWWKIALVILVLRIIRMSF